MSTDVCSRYTEDMERTTEQRGSGDDEEAVVSLERSDLGELNRRTN